MLDGLPSGLGIVVLPLAGGSLALHEPPTPPHAWSTIKPLIAVAVLRARRAGELAGGSAPTAEEHSLIERAIEDSDNEAAAQLFSELGSTDEATAAMQRVLLDTGDHTTRVNAAALRPEFSTYGQTSWPLAQEAGFYRELANGCLLGVSDTHLILDAMARVTPTGGSGWGLPTAGFPDLRSKAGWGPEQGSSAYTALQYGVVGDAETGGYVVGVVAETSGDSTTAFGEVSTLAKRLAATLAGRRGRTGAPAC